MSHEHLSVSYTELDNGVPAICLCSDFVIPITNKGLPKSFIGFYDKELKFNLNNLSNSLVKFKTVSDDEELLEIYYKNMFIGYISMPDMYDVFVQCYNTLMNL